MYNPQCFDFSSLNNVNKISIATNNEISNTKVLLENAHDLKSIDAAITDLYNNIMPIQFLRLVSTDAEIRTEATNTYNSLQLFELEFVRDERLYKIINETKVDDHDFETKRVKQMYLLDFELKGGLKLQSEERQKLAQLKDQVIELCSVFQKNLSDDDSYVLMTRDDLNGLDDSFINSLEQKDGMYVVTIKYPHSIPVLKLATNPETRKKMWISAISKATSDKINNQSILPKIASLRREIALLLGFDSDTSLCLSNKQRMAESTEQVREFLDKTSNILKAKVEIEMSSLRKIKTEYDIYPWDLSYLNNKRLKSEFDVDHEIVKNYFPLEHVLNGVLHCYSTLLSIKFVRDTDAESLAWHKDVMCYRMMDLKSGDFIARFYMDLHPRPGKYSHAACYWLGKKGQAAESFPTVCMVTNFTEKTVDKPALLRFDEVKTFFHEFGHVCHACLSRSNYQRLNWTWTSVEMDFLEVPSLCFEKFIFDRDILEILSKHYLTGRVLPEDLRKGLVRASNASSGYAWSRSISLAKLDIMIHSPNPIDPEKWRKYEMDVWKDLTGINHPDELNSIPAWASFEHLSTAYNSGYYSYIWSEVVACSIFSMFETNGNFLDPDLGMKLRKEILEPCALLTGTEMVRNFLGRDFDKDAFRKTIYANC